MLKPELFQQRFVALRNIPYLCGAPEYQDHIQGGVLHKGQTVWTNYTTPPEREVRSESAFVDGIGIISLDPHWLVPADILKQQTGDADGKNC